MRCARIRMIEPPQKMTWALAIATKDRMDVLKRCVECALDQTWPPSEIVVADASSDWEDHGQEIRAIVGEKMPGLPVAYEKGTAPSLTVQRNQAAGLASADILFMIDDDSLMHDTCAEEIMKVYEADTEARIAGVQAFESPHLPGRVPQGGQKEKGTNTAGIRKKHPLLRWFFQKALMMEKTEVFLPYDGAYPEHLLPDGLKDFKLNPVKLFGGFRMTYRRNAVLASPFDPTLRYYCPGEDLDGSYRISRLGMLVTAYRAKLHHFTSAEGRLNRHQVALLWSLNQAVLLRRHAPDQAWAKARYWRHMAHRIAIDFVKDLGKRRFSLPQMRGSLAAWRRAGEVFAMTPEALETWYPQAQEKIVKGGR